MVNNNINMKNLNSFNLNLENVTKGVKPIIINNTNKNNNINKQLKNFLSVLNSNNSNSSHTNNNMSNNNMPKLNHNVNQKNIKTSQMVFLQKIKNDLSIIYNNYTHIMSSNITRTRSNLRILLKDISDLRRRCVKELEPHFLNNSNVSKSIKLDMKNVIEHVLALHRMIDTEVRRTQGGRKKRTIKKNKKKNNKTKRRHKK